MWYTYSMIIADQKLVKRIVTLRKRGGVIPPDAPQDFSMEDLKRAISHIERKTQEFWDMMANVGHIPGNVPTVVLLADMIDFLPLTTDQT